MSNNKMLIDAGHPEETRVAMVRGNRVDEFDFESEHKTQLRGNIYLAKVTRVEPSLQAAFVDYGGNRHGFLAFSEIHPDYYQIPMADRQALLEAEAEDAREAAAAEDASVEGIDEDEEDEDEESEPKPARKRRSRRRGGKKSASKASAQDNDDTEDDDADSEDNQDSEEDDDDDTTIAAENESDDVVSEPSGSDDEKPKKPRATRRKASAGKAEAASAEASSGNDSGDENQDEADEKPKRRRTSRKKAAADEVAEEPAKAEAVAAENDDEAAGDHDKKPARGRAKRKTSRSEASTADGDEDTDSAVGEDEAEKSSSRRTARRRKSAKTETQDEDSSQADAADEAGDSDEEAPVKARKEGGRRSRGDRSRRGKRDEAANGEEAEAEDVPVEEVGSQDALEEVPTRRPNRRHYKIQEVIKRRQILLVQVVKEERGNKGAALTTYLSLAGRYSVLMPNTARGGGISRKITNVQDRKRLKSIAGNLEVPKGMGVILRTAGASRSPEEIQRDFEYLMRLWENVRTLTLQSTAPCLVYEEGSLIKRSIRDLYDKDTGEILVAGEAGYREAKDFMTMLMPEHAKNVKLYKDRVPLFARMGVEAQLDAMLQPQVTLKSGGYLIIDQTEALVAIDVNSGRSTRQHSIEETAVQTNLEAADEVARQLRLRDLAGLIVIDFIDMDEKRNIRAVEKRLKDALKNDRARIQVGRISHFGLMEMSRQRIRASVLESTTQVCPVCDGLGHVRSSSSIVLGVLRAIEEYLNRNSRNNLTVKVSTDTALYLLNHKKESLSDLEERFGVSISIATDDSLGSKPCELEKGEPSNRVQTEDAPIQPDSFSDEIDDISSEDADAEAETASAEHSEETNGNRLKEDGEPRKKRRRRKRRRGKNGGETSNGDAAAAQADAEDGETAGDDDSEDGSVDDQADIEPAAALSEDAEAATSDTESDGTTDETAKSGEEDDDDAEPQPARSRRTRRTRRVKAEKEPSETAATNGKYVESDEASDVGGAEEAEPAEAAAGAKPAQAAAEPPKPARRNTRRRADGPTPPAAETMKIESTVSTDGDGDEKPKKGWWSRKFF